MKIFTIIFIFALFFWGCSKTEESLTSPITKQNLTKTRINSVSEELQWSKNKVSPVDNSYFPVSFPGILGAWTEADDFVGNHAYYFERYIVMVNGNQYAIIEEKTTNQCFLNVLPNQIYNWQICAQFTYIENGLVKYHNIYYDNGNDFIFQRGPITPNLTGSIVNNHPYLSWNQTTQSDGYDIYYSNDNLNYQILVHITSGATTFYNDISYSLNSTTPRYYKIRSTKFNESSPYSDPIKFGGPSQEI